MHKFVLPYLFSDVVLSTDEQELLNARKREIETENHMKQIGMYTDVFFSTFQS